MEPMIKIAFMGAGSTVFAKNVLGDCMCAAPLKDAEIALYDIDAQRLADSQLVIGAITVSYTHLDVYKRQFRGR